MIKWLRKKIVQSREWRANNQASWVGYDETDSDGITQFQRELLASLKENPGVSAVQLIEGNEENYYKGTLEQSALEFYLYGDEAELSGSIYERWAFDSRQDLTRQFLSNARDREI